MSWENAELLGLLKHWHEKQGFKIHYLCGLSAFHLHPNLFFVVVFSFFFTLTVKEMPPMVGFKRILSCHVMREQIHSVLTGNLWRLDVCQNAHHFAGINEPSNVQVPCVKGSFVFRITRMLLCVFHCSPWMAVTFCCPMKGNQNLEWADGSQWDCCPFSYAWRSMSQHRNIAIFFSWWKYVEWNAKNMVSN